MSSTSTNGAATTPKLDPERRENFPEVALAGDVVHACRRLLSAVDEITATLSYMTVRRDWFEERLPANVNAGDRAKLRKAIGLDTWDDCMARSRRDIERYLDEWPSIDSSPIAQEDGLRHLWSFVRGDIVRDIADGFTFDQMKEDLDRIGPLLEHCHSHSDEDLEAAVWPFTGGSELLRRARREAGMVVRQNETERRQQEDEEMSSRLKSMREAMDRSRQAAEQELAKARELRERIASERSK